MPTKPAATDTEIAAAGARLGLIGQASANAHWKVTAGHVRQSLAHGRSRIVPVEIKRLASAVRASAHGEFRAALNESLRPKSGR